MNFSESGVMNKNEVHGTLPKTVSDLVINNGGRPFLEKNQEFFLKDK